MEVLQKSFKRQISGKQLHSAGSALLKIVLVILVGMPASLLVTAAVAKNIRKVVNTKMEPPDVAPPSAPFTANHHIAWSKLIAPPICCLLLRACLYITSCPQMITSLSVASPLWMARAFSPHYSEKTLTFVEKGSSELYPFFASTSLATLALLILIFYRSTGAIAAVSLLATALGPAEWAAKLVVPFLLACTVEGLLLGSAVPSNIAKFVHPLITCSVVANVGAALFGLVSGWSYKHTLTLYLTKVTSLSIDAFAI